MAQEASSCDGEMDSNIMLVKNLEDDYVLGETLGSGNFAVVRRGKCKRTGKEVAIKVIPKSRQNAASIRHEVAVLKRVSLHKRIASLEACYETADAFYIVMEHVSGGDVFDHLCEHGAYTERDAAVLVSELAGAVALLHAQGLAHADIKPENLLLTSDGHAKLVDFGLSAAYQGDARVDPNAPSAVGGALLGTAAYWAPEVFGSRDGPGLANDVWGLGILTYMILAAGHPFDDEGKADDAKIKSNILTGEPSWSGFGASPAAKSFVQMLLRKDPSARPTIEQLLQHPWIRSGGAGPLGVDEARKRSAKLAAFRQQTARLRAACFAVLTQQLAIDERKRAAEKAGGGTKGNAGTGAGGGAGTAASMTRTRSARLRRHESVRDSMLEADVLSRAFRVFDGDGKGYLSVGDLQRVLSAFGQAGEANEWMQGSTDGDREGRRITYGSFVRMMSQSTKRAADAGDYIFEQGDPVRYFYCLLSGEVEVLQRKAGMFGGEEVLNTLRAGEYFGENSLLEGSNARSVSIRCTTPVEVLRLSRDDFEAAFGGGSGKRSDGTLTRQPSAAEAELRERLLSFIRMVSPQQRRRLRRGEDVFSAGDPADRFHILASGRLVVHDGGDAASGQVCRKFGEIAAGEGFGEATLLGRKAHDRPHAHTKTITCKTADCEVVEILGEDFLRLLEKSRVVRESFQRLHSRRTAQNEQAARK